MKQDQSRAQNSTEGHLPLKVYASSSAAEVRKYFEDLELSGGHERIPPRRSSPTRDLEEWGRRQQQHRAEKKNRREAHSGGFRCAHAECGAWISIDEMMGTRNRNHCPTCLWSLHLDDDSPGDRASTCKARMKPVALTFKIEGSLGHIHGSEGQGDLRHGELMLVHKCTGCGVLRINRIAADDCNDRILQLYRESMNLPADERRAITDTGIAILDQSHEAQVQRQLLGMHSFDDSPK